MSLKKYVSTTSLLPNLNSMKIYWITISGYVQHPPAQSRAQLDQKINDIGRQNSENRITSKTPGLANDLVKCRLSRAQSPLSQTRTTRNCSDPSQGSPDLSQGQQEPAVVALSQTDQETFHQVKLANPQDTPDPFIASTPASLKTGSGQSWAITETTWLTKPTQMDNRDGSIWQTQPGI